MFENIIQILTNVGLYSSAFRLATPLLFAALGGVIAERAGVLTFCAEGLMLIGAFFAVLGSSLTDNVWFGIALGVVSSGLVSLIYAFLVVTIRANQIVSSVALNIFAMGVTSFLFSSIFGVIQVPMRVAKLSPWNIPYLSQIPFLGPVLFQHVPLVYLSLFLLPVVQFILYRTKWGLTVRSVGEHPHAADSLGINVFRVRYQTILIAGLMAGLGGAFLSIGQLGTFIDNMVSGRGFIAYTTIVFGKWTPIGTFFGCLLFGFADSLQMRFQSLGINIPSQIFITIPYVITLIILTFYIGRAVMPAASAKPFSREEG